MSGLELSDFEAFKKTPAATTSLYGAGDYIERQKAIIARDEAEGYYESSPEADWENAQGSTGYTPLDDEDFDRAEQLLARREVARELPELPPTMDRRAEARDQTRALLAEQEWEAVYDLGYADGHGDGETSGRESESAKVSELNDMLNSAQLEIIRLRRLLAG